MKSTDPRIKKRRWNEKAASIIAINALTETKEKDIK
jgi:hypothetical protein